MKNNSYNLPQIAPDFRFNHDSSSIQRSLFMRASYWKTITFNHLQKAVRRCCSILWINVLFLSSL